MVAGANRSDEGASSAVGEDGGQRVWLGNSGLRVWRTLMLERVLWAVWIAVTCALLVQLREVLAHGDWWRLSPSFGA